MGTEASTYNRKGWFIKVSFLYIKSRDIWVQPPGSIGIEETTESKYLKPTNRPDTWRREIFRQATKTDVEQEAIHSICRFQEASLAQKCDMHNEKELVAGFHRTATRFAAVAHNLQRIKK